MDPCQDLKFVFFLDTEIVVMALHQPQGSRLLGVQDPVIPQVQAWVREHPGTISLGQGIVAYGPPAIALDVLSRFGQDPSDHRYGPVGGDPELRAMLESKLAADNGIILGSGQSLLVTAGSNMAFFETILAMTSPGDEVLLPTPFYFNHEMAIGMLGCKAVPVPSGEGYALDLLALEKAITPRTRAIVTVSPNNPTGCVYSEASLRAVNRLCAERGLYHLSDEAYEYFVWGDTPHFSPAAISGAEAHTVGFYSLSKTLGLAGWRIGYMVVPRALESSLVKIQDTNLICPPRPSQAAAVAALREGRRYFEQAAAPLQGLRSDVLEALATLGQFLLEPPRSEGAFYVFLNVATTLKSMVLAERLAREHGVAVVPGEAFGIQQGCYLRVAYGAPDPDTVREGVRRLIRGIRAILERP